MSHHHFIAREGWGYILFFLVLSAVAYYLSYEIAAVITLVICIFIAFFFRNPERHPVNDELAILAPADGKVLSIENVSEGRHLEAEAIKISIFLSLFNVHINRAPIKSRVDWTSREGFSFLPAYKAGAADTNVRNYLALTSAYGRLMVVQITGLVARRLVCWAKAGDELSAGSRFGLIKFGSCTEIYVPKDTSVLVDIGQRVRGGETVIGRFDN
ncbi:MAG: phosphatidylserine decarboxylase family protein [Deltaproteobacteria bacterium]